MLKEGDSGPLVVGLLALLCLAYGVERLSYSSDVVDQLSLIKATLSDHARRTPDAKFSSDQNEVWSQLIESLSNTENEIRTVQAGDRPSNAPDAYKNFGEILANRLVQMKRSHPVKFRIVLVFDDQKTKQELKEIYDLNVDRLAFYESKGLNGDIELSIFEHQPLMKFDVMIIDDRDVCIGFDTYEGQGTSKNNIQYQNLMLWKNQPALAGKLGRWFNNSVWNNAEPFKVWARRKELAKG